MNNIIVGSGISGLFAGLYLSQRGHNVTIIEKEKSIGGLLKSFDYKYFGVFDYGMHNFLETGIEEIDQSIFNLLPENQWNKLIGEKRDLAGLFFNGKLQLHSPYIDIRYLKKKSLNELIKHFKATQHKNYIVENAKDFLEMRFGSEISKTLNIVLEKNFNSPANMLDIGAVYLTPLSRLVISDENQTLKYYESEFLRERIAFPEQRNLPLNLSSGRMGYYPKDFGIYRVVEAFKKEILLNGGKIITSSSVKNIVNKKNKIEKIIVDYNGKTLEYDKINNFIWTVNMVGLSKLLNHNFDGYKYDPPLTTYVVNILIDKKPNLEDLYYFYCYDKGFKTFRLTNYYSYCENAKRNEMYPISMELLIDQKYSFSKENIEKLAITELKKFKILEEYTNIKFIKVEKLISGIPMLTKNNVSTLKSIRDKIKFENIPNLIMTGVLSEDNLFFQTEVLIDVYKKIKVI